MRTHPLVIIGGIIQEDPFFVPPDEFLRELRERRDAERTTPRVCFALYSALSAITGSTRSARRAGTTHASTQATARAKGASSITTGFSGSTA